MYEGLDTIVLYEELAYEDVVPLAWRALPEPFDPAVVGSFADRNLRALQALAALDESGQLEKPDDSQHAADIARLDLKVNLLLDMVGKLLVASQPRPRATSIRFNALGAVWQGVTPAPPLGNQGVLEVYLRDCIADPLRLVGRIASVAPDGRIKARFIPPGEHISDLLEKLAFRKHRRQVAGARNPKK
ncbi:PilZ domain-containing protein [Povalibacter sp.]|uniref:PilZ domain-containing protein n=1 Tax=Povalibacter sp. TaxID=1962978 RepID=UPI002F3E7A5E